VRSFVPQQSQQQVPWFDMLGVSTLGFLRAVGEHPLARSSEGDPPRWRLSFEMEMSSVPASNRFDILFRLEQAHRQRLV